MAENDVLKMKVADLKRELKIRGLATTGNKNELQERLQTAMLDGDLALEDPSIGEDLLDDALTDDEDKGLDLSNEDAVLQSPDKDEDKSLATTLAAEQSQLPPKKVVLKRKVSISVPSSTSDATNTPTDDESGEKIAKITAPSEDASADDKQADGGKTVIKLSEMSMKDRMEMRAKKFGTSSSSSAAVATTTLDAKAAARAARFGITTTAKADSTNSSANISTAQPAASMEMLKKRAERFGCSVSSKMVELERKEKLLKRQERFGEGADETKKTITTETSSNGTSSSSASDYAEKAKQRLERFKTVVK